jgi:uncharacterized membrane protein YidH (DUF202 family)
VGAYGRGAHLIGILIERAGALMGGGEPDLSVVFGLVLVGLGCLALVLGALQFFRNHDQIIRGRFMPAIGAYVVILVGSLTFAGAFIFYVLLA